MNIRQQSCERCGLRYLLVDWLIWRRAGFCTLKCMLRELWQLGHKLDEMDDG